MPSERVLSGVLRLKKRRAVERTDETTPLLACPLRELPLSSNKTVLPAAATVKLKAPGKPLAVVPRTRVSLGQLARLSRNSLYSIHTAKLCACRPGSETTDCLLWIGKTSARYPEARYTNHLLGLNNNTIYLHQVSALIQFMDSHTEEEVMALREHLASLNGQEQSIQYTASHLCYHGLCFALGHVIIESQADNNRRQNCQALVCPNCSFAVGCIHEPKCLLLHGGVCL